MLLACDLGSDRIYLELYTRQYVFQRTFHVRETEKYEKGLNAQAFLLKYTC